MKKLLHLVFFITVVQASAKQVTLEWPKMQDEAVGLYVMEALAEIGPKLLDTISADAVQWTGEFSLGSYNVYIVPYNHIGMLGVPSDILNVTIKMRVLESSDDLGRWIEETRFEEIDRPRRFYHIKDLTQP